MISDKIISLIFLIFTILVSVINFCIGRYEHVLFTIPFILSLVIKSKVSKYFEVLGLLVIFWYVMIVSDTYLGIMGLVITSVFFFVYSQSRIKSKIFIYINILFIFIYSFYDNFALYSPKHLVIRSLSDAGLYFVGSITLFLLLYKYYFDVTENKIEKLFSAASESVEIAKKVIDIHKKDNENDR